MRLWLGDSDIDVVGVVGDAKYGSVKEDVEPQLFFPIRQWRVDGRAVSYYVRSTLPPEQLLGTIAEVVAELDPLLPVTGLRTMAQQVREGTAEDRAIAALASAFAVLADGRDRRHAWA